MTANTLFLCSHIALLLIICAIVPLSVVANADVNSTNQPDLTQVFHRFMKEYKKNYAQGSSEYRYRFQIFKATLERIKQLNENRTNPTSALYGITKFSDLSPKEFERKLIFGQFKRSKYALKAKYLPTNERYKYSDNYYNPKGLPPMAHQNHQKQPIDHQKRFEEQKRNEYLQRPDTMNVSKGTKRLDAEMQQRVKEFKQMLTDWPDEHFDRKLLEKQAKMDVHEHLLNLDQMKTMIQEEFIEKMSRQLIQLEQMDLTTPPEHNDTKSDDLQDASFGLLTSGLMEPQADQPAPEAESEDDISPHVQDSFRENLIKQLPVNFPMHKDWRKDGIIGEVLDQGTCGGCWAISAVQIIESMVALKNDSKQVQQLSIQQMLDCASGNYGCEGGDTCNALQWMVDQKIRLATRQQYPSKLGESGKCRRASFAKGVSIAPNFTCKDFSSSAAELLKLIAYHGPVTSAVDATSWQDYLGGIIQFNCGHRRNHAVQLIGFDISGPIPYYIVKNSWGTEFGLSGYLHVAIGANLCDIEKRISAVDVL